MRTSPHPRGGPVDEIGRDTSARWAIPLQQVEHVKARLRVVPDILAPSAWYHSSTAISSANFRRYLARDGPRLPTGRPSSAASSLYDRSLHTSSTST